MKIISPFFTKWDNSVRKLDEHQIVLPPDYLGFLLTMALKLTSEEIKLLLNFTQGKLGTKSVKEWVRVHETNLDHLTKTTSSTTASSADKRASPLLLAEDEEIEHGTDYPDEDGDLEILLNAMTSLDSDDGTISEDSNQVFDEDEVKEVLAAMIRSHGKGGGKRTFTAVNQAKRSKELARGYGAGRLAGHRFQNGDTYRVTMENLKRRTRCGHCKQVGHWWRECPTRSSKTEIKENHLLENQEALFLNYLEYKRSQATVQPLDPGTSSSSSNRDPSTAEAYMSAPPLAQVHECWFVQGQLDDDCCGTIDTGCQRSAIGAETLNRLLSKQPKAMPVAMVPEAHQFRSVSGLSKTDKVACIPTSLGTGGCILRPAVFEDSFGRHAPLLLSLPFLLSCRSVLELDPEKGLSLYLKRFQKKVPLHIGPTGALRIPLHEFDDRMVDKLTQALQELKDKSASEIMNVSQSPACFDQTKSESATCDPCSGFPPSRNPHEAQPHHGNQNGVSLAKDGSAFANVACAPLRPPLPEAAGGPDRVREPQRGVQSACDLRNRDPSTLKAGPNYQRTFFSCPEYKSVTRRCNYFQWTPVQPFWGTDQSSPATPGKQEPITMEQLHCQHPQTTRQGSNGHMVQVKCKQCGLVLDRQERSAVPEEPVKPSRPSRPQASSSEKPKDSPPEDPSYQEWLEFKQFQEFRKHKSK